MFKTIFCFEIGYWFRRREVYAYAAAFFLFALLLMYGVAGGWDGATVSGEPVALVNSPLRINWIISYFMQLIVFLVPAVIGMAIYRDFSSNTHALLYAYPIDKRDYLPAKFAGAGLVLCLVVTAIGAGSYCGTLLPGVNPARVGTLHAGAYLQTYLVYIYPNVLFFGTIIFAVVALTRSIYTGFVVVVLFYFADGLVWAFARTADSSYIAAMLDPLGRKAAGYYARYWTLAEQNSLPLPVKGIVIYNRLLWGGIAALVGGLAYRHFHFHHATLSWGRRSAEAKTAPLQTGRVGLPLQLPRVRYDFSLRQQLCAIWYLSNFELSAILKNRMFRSLLLTGLLMIFFQLLQVNPQYNFKTLPVTWNMLLVPTIMFSGVVNILTFLYAGMLVHRARMARINQLEDVTPTANATRLLAMLLALIKMQVLLLTLVLLAGVAVQAFYGYYRFEIGHYLFELYLLNLPGHILWAMAALLVSVLVPNPWLGFFLLLLASLGVSGLPEIGVRHLVFRFNSSPELIYSDLDGYGDYLRPFFIYKLYWLFFGIALLPAGLLFWVRGFSHSLRERLHLARERFYGRLAVLLLLFSSAFLAGGMAIYYHDTVQHSGISPAENKSIRRQTAEKSGIYRAIAQPRIVALDLSLDIFPQERRFQAAGHYRLLNKTTGGIDTLLVNHDIRLRTTCRPEGAALIQCDTVLSEDGGLLQVDWLKLARPMLPGDSLMVNFAVSGKPLSLVRSNTLVNGNGAVLWDTILPRFGDWTKLTGWPHPDSSDLGTSILSRDSDLISFEATVSTSAGQHAVAPGILEREWSTGGRHYFHYRIPGPAVYNFAFGSGRFAVLRDRWKDVELEIYYHPEHSGNLQHLMNGMKASLAWCSAQLGPYQYSHLRLVEFPRSQGRFARSFPGLILASESAGFLARVDEQDADDANLPFELLVHEVAHQWWAYQVTPAEVAGGEMILESLPQYASAAVLQQTYGEAKRRAFLKNERQIYLRSRTGATAAEDPLMFIQAQPWLRYQKGALILSLLSDYLGEERLHTALRGYLEQNRFREAPYSTSRELVNGITAVTPDSLRYLLRDGFEAVTLYNNRLRDATVHRLPNGRYRAELDIIISKYRVDKHGERVYSDDAGESLSWQDPQQAEPLLSLPLRDYVEVSLTGEGGSELYRQLHRFDSIQQIVVVELDDLPLDVALDPDNKLIDIDVQDNRRAPGAGSLLR